MMNVLKHPSFFRPTSRPSSPAPLTTPSSVLPSSVLPPNPDSSNGLDRARPPNKLSLSTFRRPSPAPGTALNAAPGPLVQDGSYLEILSLKLSEAVSKALAQPTGPAAANEQVLGKRAIPQGRGHALGALIASELKATQDSPHLHRAIIRSLHRPLSVLLTNLSSHLLPLISSPAFQSAPTPTVQSPNPNPTQLHAIAIANFVGELLETFDALDLGTDVDLRGDGLKTIREGLVSLINRVVGPLVNSIRNELTPLLDALEVPNLLHGIKWTPGVKASVVHHPSIVILQGIMPVYAKALARYTTSTTSQSTLATFLISVIWRGLVALAHRPYTPPSPPSSPPLLPVAIKKRRGSTSPPLTPPAGRFAIKLPPSRPPSPPPATTPATAAADARALYDLLSLLPFPSAEKPTTRLAREVVDDALEGLRALPPLLDAVHSVTASKLDSQDRLDDIARELEVLATEVPLLIALPVLLQVPINGGSTSVSVWDMIGLTEAEYRKQCLSGFGRAEECATTVALRVLEALRTNQDVHPVVSKWLVMEIVEELEQGH
ncbi:hypothetical protein Hypma_008031 [Hypsizygus marmoreus]|uniref:Uncharacterized protein n=1 Tax=Hypsizygus marmoreus TaxID=39966 RepID=A0A369K0X7_HYPMA|nr:hypothetical protein Hypma_008031 [Hypsizygus marmoreus]